MAVVMTVLCNFAPVWSSSNDCNQQANYDIEIRSSRHISRLYFSPCPIPIGGLIHQLAWSNGMPKSLTNLGSASVDLLHVLFVPHSKIHIAIMFTQ